MSDCKSRETLIQMKHFLLLAFTLYLNAGTVYAGWDKADTCATSLPKDARLIYDRVKPKVVVGDRDGNSKKFQSIVKELVKKGELSAFTAREQAKKAAACMGKVIS